MLLGVRFLFDHHDINPELFEIKFGRKRLEQAPPLSPVLLAERLTFFFSRRASIATNQSYKQIAISRGHMHPDRVFVVRSARICEIRPRRAQPALEKRQKIPRRLPRHHRPAGRPAIPRRGSRNPQTKRPANDIGWIVIGDGPTRQDIISLAAQAASKMISSSPAASTTPP